MEIILVLILVGVGLFLLKMRFSAWTSFSDDLIARKKREDENKKNFSES